MDTSLSDQSSPGPGPSLSLVINFSTDPANNAPPPPLATASVPTLATSTDSTASKPLFNAFTWYRLTCAESGVALDVVNDEYKATLGTVTMSGAGSFSGQHWRLRPLAGGVYVLNSMYLGSDRRLEMSESLVSKRAWLSRGRMAVQAEKQMWRVERVPGEEEEYTITNVLEPLELGWKEVDSRRQVLLGEEGLATRWRIEVIEAVS